MVFTTTSRGHQLQPKQTTIPPTTSRPTPKNSPMVSPDEHIAGAYYHVTTFDDFRPTLREYFITQVHVTKRTKQTKEKLTKANDNGFSSNDNDTIKGQSDYGIQPRRSQTESCNKIPRVLIMLDKPRLPSFHASAITLGYRTRWAA